MSNLSVKERLRQAAADGGQEDEHWHVGGTERLYFHSVDDVHTAGCVDVRGAGAKDEPPYVKVELWVPPALAEQVIGLVCGKRSES